MGRSKELSELLGRYQEVAAVAQDMQGRIVTALRDADGRDVAGRVAIFLGALDDLTVLRDRCEQQLTESMEAIESVFRSDTSQRAWCGDYAVHIKSEWALLPGKWPERGQELDEVSAAFEKISLSLDQVVFLCASLTITPRVNDILENLRVGEAIAFEAAVGESLPRSGQLRTDLLKEVADQDGVLQCGYLDRNSGMIYRVASTRASQWWSLGRVILAASIGLGLVVGSCFVSPGDGWPFTKAMWVPQAERYTFMIAGAVGHLAIQGVTLARSGKQPVSRPWNDWILWLNAHESQVLLGVLSLIVGFLSLSFTMKDAFTWPTAFFAGYSIDSLTDVVIDRFERLASTQTKRIEDAVKASGGLSPPGTRPSSTTAAT